MNDFHQVSWAKSLWRPHSAVGGLSRKGHIWQLGESEKASWRRQLLSLYRSVYTVKRGESTNKETNTKGASDPLVLELLIDKRIFLKPSPTYSPSQ